MKTNSIFITFILALLNFVPNLLVLYIFSSNNDTASWNVLAAIILIVIAEIWLYFFYQSITKRQLLYFFATIFVFFLSFCTIYANNSYFLRQFDNEMSYIDTTLRKIVRMFLFFTDALIIFSQLLKMLFSKYIYFKSTKRSITQLEAILRGLLYSFVVMIGVLVTFYLNVTLIYTDNLFLTLFSFVSIAPLLLYYVAKKPLKRTNLLYFQLTTSVLSVVILQFAPYILYLTKMDYVIVYQAKYYTSLLAISIIFITAVDFVFTMTKTYFAAQQKVKNEATDTPILTAQVSTSPAEN